MSETQKTSAKKILRDNLENYTDWIVLNNTMDTLSKWAIKDSRLEEWLLPHLERLARDPRKSVAGRAKKIKTALM
jgi:hypothetical protein